MSRSRTTSASAVPTVRWCSSALERRSFMHSAPSVTYPVGRTRGATRILLALWTLGVCCAGAACYLFDSNGWRQLLLLLSVVFSGVAAGFGLRRDGAATLHFDGLHWSLTGA